MQLKKIHNFICEGIKVVVVGIGSGFTDSKVSCIVENPDIDIIHVDDFDTLSAYENTVANITCHGNTWVTNRWDRRMPKNKELPRDDRKHPTCNKRLQGLCFRYVVHIDDLSRYCDACTLE